MGTEEDIDRSILNYSFYGSNNWDPIASLSQIGDFATEFSNPHLAHFPSDSSLVGMVPKASSSFGDSMGRISESGRDCPDFALRNGVGNQRALTTIADSQEHGQNSEDGLLGPSPYGKRKMKGQVEASLETAEEQQKDSSGDTSESPNERDGKKNLAVKLAKDKSVGAEPSKEEGYVHMRARRGQATNSHSLAERVRREKISERMRLLQELVPGCNKITGKAPMLDEIINYVQSLQHQVEFLSMKLATVNPELNVDIDANLSKDILHLHGSNPATPGISSGYPQGTFHSTTPPFHPTPQHIWNNELHGILQRGFDHDHDHDPAVSSLGPNGLSKMEL